MATACCDDEVNMTIFDIMEKIALPGQCIAFLRSNNLLLKGRSCDKCHNRMSLHKTVAVADGQRWNCTSCKTTKSIRDGSVFYVSI